MNPFKFTPHEPATLNRRRNIDRRHALPDVENSQRSSGGRRILILAAALFLVGGAWKWRTIVHGPTYLLRSHWSDRTDLYKGKTNGLSNHDLVLQARNYLTEVNMLDASGNITPEALRSEGDHIDLNWFKRHHPVSVDFNPFTSKGGNFVVTWRYVPGCETSAWKSGRMDMPWYDAQGKRCSVICNLSVVMEPDLRLLGIKIDPVTHA